MSRPARKLLGAIEFEDGNSVTVYSEGRSIMLSHTMSNGMVEEAFAKGCKVDGPTEDWIAEAALEWQLRRRGARFVPDR